MSFKNLAGQKFGRLLVIRIDGPAKTANSCRRSMESRFEKCETNEETTMSEIQQSIDREFDYRTMKARTAAKLWGVAVLLALALWCASAAYAQTPRTATITFTAPTTRTDGSTITGALSYEVWQGLKGGTKTKASTVNATTTTVNITTGLQGGREYCWHIVAVEAGIASAPSNEACKAFDQSPPNTVTITVT